MRSFHLPFATLVILSVATPVVAQMGRVAGVVKSTDGRPIKGATVKAQNPAAAPSEFTATSDEKGRWSIIGLRTGPWKFVAEAPGYEAQSGTANVRSLGSTNPPLEFTLAPGAPAGPAGIGKEIQTELKAADDLRSNGQLDQAIAAYQAIKARNPSLTMINMVIGSAYRQRAVKQPDKAARQASFDQAIAAYQEMLKADPGSDRAKLEIGMTHMQAGNLEAAEQALQPLAATTSATRDVFYNLGEIKFAQGDNEAAEAMFTRAAEIDSRWQAPRLKLGLVAFRKGDKEGAIRIFEAVLAAVPPESPEAAQATAFLKDLRP